MGAVISFFRPAASTRGNWSPQELAEFYRVEAALIRSGMRITSEQGLSDEADPWFVFCGIDGDAFIHFARIDGNYVVASDALDHPMRGSDFRNLLNDIAARHPNLLPLHRTDAGTKLVIHPAALLAAIVAAAALALAPDDAFAHDAGGDAASHDAGSPPSQGDGAALEPPPASVKDHSDGRHQGDNRRQAEAVLFTAMAFAAQAAAADELEHRSAADPLQGGQAGAGTAHLTQSEVGSSAGSSAGSAGAQAAPAQALSPLGATSGASTQASSTSGGSERISAPHQQDKGELVGEGPGPVRAAAADAELTGVVDNPSASVAGATDTTTTTGTARSSGTATAGSASDPLNSADTARSAKQADTSSNTDDGINGRASHPATIQAQHQDNVVKTTVFSNLRSDDDGSPKRSDKENGNQGHHGLIKAELAAGEAQGEDVAASGSSLSHGNGSDSENAPESGSLETAPGQLKKAGKSALASETSDPNSANIGNEQGSYGSKTAPGKEQPADTHDAALEASGASRADESGQGPDGSGTIQGKVKHEDKLATASDASGPASDDGNPQGPSIAASAPVKQKHTDKVAAAPDGADIGTSAATSTDAQGPAGKDKAAEHSNSESAPGRAKHDAQAVEASDAANSEASAPGNSSGHGSNKGATLAPAGLDRVSPQVENDNTSSTAAPTSHEGNGLASGHHKPQAHSIDGTESAIPTRSNQSYAEAGSLDAHSKSNRAENPSSSPNKDKIKPETTPAKIDPSGNLMFASDHQARSEAHGPSNGSPPDADAHTDVGLVGIAHHHGALHHPDYH